MLETRILKTLEAKGFHVSKNDGEVNIVYLEGSDEFGSPVPNTPNVFNDRRIVIVHVGGVPQILGNWEATTEPGKKYTIDPLNPNGAARIAFGQYQSWEVGFHNLNKPSGHEALVQVAPIKVYRDLNKDFKRDGDTLYEGLFGVNQHHGYNQGKNSVEGASAGCLVGRLVAEHEKFMALCKEDPRYKKDKKFRFYTTVLPVAELLS
jgi:hypothetical protein